MFLLILTLMSAYKPIRDTTIVVTGDTIFITSGRIWNSTGTIDISDSTYIARFYGEYFNASDSLTTPKIKTDIIAPKDSTDIEFIDDVIIDSTLIVKREKIEILLGIGASNEANGNNLADNSTFSVTYYVYENSGINVYNIDSVLIDTVGFYLDIANADSIRWDSVKVNIIDFALTGHITQNASVNLSSIVTDSDTLVYGVSDLGAITNPFVIAYTTYYGYVWSSANPDYYTRPIILKGTKYRN